MAKPIEKEKAIELRKLGKSLYFIAKELNVSKGSVSSWVREIKLTPEQKILIVKNCEHKRFKVGNTIVSEIYRNKRKEYQKFGIELLNKYGGDFFAGCCLYWAEGTKSRTGISLINTDPYLLLCFKDFLIKYFGVPIYKIKLRCSFYDDEKEKIKEVEKYWCDILDLPSSCLVKSAFSSATRKNHKWGMARIMLQDVKIIQAIYGAIQHRCGFVNEKWLG